MTEAEAGRAPAPAPPPVPRDTVFRVAAVVLLVVLVAFSLRAGAPILVPFVEAVLVWFIVNALATSLRRITVQGRTLRAGQSLGLAALIIALLAIAGVYSGVTSLVSVGPQATRIQTSLDPLLQAVARTFGTDSGVVLGRAVDALGLETLMRQLVVGFLGLINQFGLIAIYVAFLLVDQAFFPAKLRLLFPDPDRREKAERLLHDLRVQIGAYLWIMTKLSALTATASYVIMVIVGLENPVFWAMLIFLLNFIPTIGSILGALLPSAFALVQFQDIGSFALVLGLLGIIQFFVGNVVLPRMAGQTLNLSLTVTMLSLAVWGSLWGVTGMFLAVPLTAVLILIASRFEATRPVAVLLSRTGELQKIEVPEPGAAGTPP